MFFKGSGNQGNFLKAVHLHEENKKEDSANYRRVSLTSVSVTVMGTVFMEAISKQMKNKKVTGSSQHRLF